jgi:lipooligosaccharide transport system permease protein
VKSTLASDLFGLPHLGRGVFSVWQRNFLYFRRSFVISLFWVFFEPILYLVAMGYGIGSFVTRVEGMSYPEFLAPSLMAMTGMLVSYFESTYSCYTKMTRQKTFNTIILSPISASEVALGEIMWGASKGLLSGLAVLLVALLLGLVKPTLAVAAVLVLSLECWLFSAFGVLMTTYARNYDWFVYAQSGLIIPMSLLSGTYFPLERLPAGIEAVSYLLPLTHAVMAMRELLRVEVKSGIFINCLFLFVLAVLLTNWAAARFQRKITY